jgi:uncharacterized protein YoxC
MDTAAQILVIILAVVLAVFLILAIILIIYLIRVSAEIRKITEATRRTIDTIESTVEGASRLTSPVFIAQFLNKYIKRMVRNYTKGKK